MLDKLVKHMRDKIPPDHLDFINELSLYEKIGDYVFVHAGIDPYKGLAEQLPQDLMCIRDLFLNYYKQADFKPPDYMVVHGHTPSKAPIIRPHRIGVDTGIYISGVLSCAVFEGADVRFLQVEGDI